ncbi:MAG: ABC transporter substrate-binding protein [Georgenia sp.]
MSAHSCRLMATAAFAVAALVLSGCTGGGDSGDGASSSDGGDATAPLIVWTLEALPERIIVQQTIIDAFTAKTGIKVDLVGADEDQVNSLVQSAAISQDLPDVIGALTLPLVRQYDSLELVDADAAAAVVDTLGEDTWAPAALALTRDGDRQLSVPSDGWGQIILYRTDLFKAAGLKPPTTYEALETAARTLTKDGMFGITLATDAAAVFTAQTFESIALGNNCQLVDEGGEILLDSPECIETFDLYGALAKDYSPAGTQTVESTRATYFAGQAAMAMWSTFILDELAGLRDNAAPSCPECVADPGFLATNTGIVSGISGPMGERATFGEITSWTILDGAPSSARTFVEYMMSDGYVDFLSMAPEGKFPVREGDGTNPSAYTDAWATLETGVDRRAKLSDFYDQSTMDAITGVATSIDRWAIPQGQGALLGPVIAELPIPKVIAEMSTGGLDGAGAARRAATDVKEIASR